MWWQTLIQNTATWLHLDLTWAGILVSYIFIFSVVLGVYILTRGTASDFKKWGAGTLLSLTVFFTYPIGWLNLWLGMLFVCLPIAIYVGYALSKTARSGEG